MSSPLPTLVALAAALTGGSAAAQTATTIHFDNAGIEFGHTPPGTIDFSVGGADFYGGLVATLGIPALYASGSYSWEVVLGIEATVDFHNAIDSIDFFFVHGTGIPPGEARVIGLEGQVLATFASVPSTFFNDPANYVAYSGEAIARLEFTGGTVDALTYTTADDCAPGAALCGDRHLLPLATGGTQELTLDAGAANAGATYLMLGSLNLGGPRFVLDGVSIPLAIDPYFLHTLAAPGAAVEGAIGVLDAEGRGTARFQLPAATHPRLAGLTLDHAFVLFDTSVPIVIDASNAESVTLVP